jgi:hypothetical protein
VPLPFVAKAAVHPGTCLDGLEKDLREKRIPALVRPAFARWPPLRGRCKQWSLEEILDLSPPGISDPWCWQTPSGKGPDRLPNAPKIMSTTAVLSDVILEIPMCDMATHLLYFILHLFLNVMGISSALKWLVGPICEIRSAKRMAEPGDLQEKSRSPCSVRGKQNWFIRFLRTTHHTHALAIIPTLQPSYPRSSVGM